MNKNDIRTVVLGSGFVATNIALRLSYRYPVYVICREPRRLIRKIFLRILEKNRVQIVQLDRINDANLEKVFKDIQPNVIINCIGMLRGSYEDLYDANVRVPTEIASAILNTLSRSDSLMIHISSAYIVGLPKVKVYEEDKYLDEKLIRPVTEYERTKYLAEKTLFDYVKRGLRLLVLRPVIMLGRYCYHEEANMFPYVVKRHRYIPIFDKGFNVLDIENFSKIVEELILKLYGRVNFEYMYVPGTYYTLTDILIAFAEIESIDYRLVRLPLPQVLIKLFTPRKVRQFLKYVGIIFESKKLHKYIEVPRDDIYEIARKQLRLREELRQYFKEY